MSTSYGKGKRTIYCLKNLQALIIYLFHIQRVYSEGIDSTLLTLLAQEAFPGRIKCTLLDAPLVPRRASKDAADIARKFGLPCQVVLFPILENEEFKRILQIAVVSAKNYPQGYSEKKLKNWEFQT